MTAEQIVEFAERLSQIAAAGGGPTALAGHLADVTGSAVLLEDARRHRIAAPGFGQAPDSAAVEDAGPRRAIALVAGSAPAGWLTVFANGARSETGNPSNRDLDLLLRLTGAAIGIELSRRPDATRERRAAFWERLIERTHHDADAARDDAVASGIVLAPAYLAVALERESGLGENPADLSELRAVATDVFRSSSADLGLLERGATLLALVPAAREVDASNARTAATLLPGSLAKRKAGLRVAGGVGTVEPPPALHRGVQAAQAALAIGRRVFGAGCVASYDDLGAYPLLYEGADLHRLQTFARGVLAPLRAYDEKHQTELAHTLRLFFDVGQNVKTAAAQLNVHRHTVFYRLRQIGEICGCALESPHDQLTLRLAVAIDALHSS
ncbi:MAG: helix-turn-helix domain-containing protein [Candidatus Tumulicola sp.]